MADLGAGVKIQELQRGLGAVAQQAEVVFGLLMNSLKGIEDEPLITTINTVDSLWGPQNRLSEGRKLLDDYYANGGSLAAVVRRARVDATLASIPFNTDQAVIEGVGRGYYYNRLKVRVIGTEDSFDFSDFSYKRFNIQVLEESEVGSGVFEEVGFIDDVSLDDVEDARYWRDVVNDISEDIRVKGSLTNENADGVPDEFKGEEHLNEAIGVGDDVETAFTHTAANLPLQPESVIIKVDGTVVADDDGEGNLEGAGVSGNVAYETGEITLSFNDPVDDTLAITVDYHTAPENMVEVQLAGGSDGVTALSQTDLTALSLQSQKKGLYAFNKHRGILQMTVADHSSTEQISRDLINYCSNRPTNDRLAVNMVPRGYSPQKAVKYKRRMLASASSFGAIYWPHVVSPNDLKGGRIEVANPVGMIVGTYARNATINNINQAPAGTELPLVGASGLEQAVEDADLDIVYPASINPIILRDEGIVLWGNKTMQETGDFVQLNTRMFFMKAENDLFGPAHVHVFKSIGNRQFDKARLQAEGYFGNLFDQGYFEADTFGEAVRVIVDNTNNTPNTIQAKNFIIDIELLENISGEHVKLRFAKKQR